MLRATTACTFSTSQLLKVVRRWCVLYILTSKCASRHNGVHFFNISTSKSGPRMVCFVHFDLEMCFAPQRCANFHLSSGQLAPHPPLWRAYFSTLRSHKSLEEHSVSRLSYLFAHLHLLSSDSFSSNLLSSNLSLHSASALLCFSSVHIVGSLTSKLPSIKPPFWEILYMTPYFPVPFNMKPPAIHRAASRWPATACSVAQRPCWWCQSVRKTVG